MLQNNAVINKVKYRLSFGTGNAYINENNLILKKYLENKDWRGEKLKNIVLRIIFFKLIL